MSARRILLISLDSVINKQAIKKAWLSSRTKRRKDEERERERTRGLDMWGNRRPHGGWRERIEVRGDGETVS